MFDVFYNNYLIWVWSMPILNDQKDKLILKRYKHCENLIKNKLNVI